MPLLVTSASGANGDGLGALLRLPERANAWGHRAITAVKWTSLGVFPVVNRLPQSELVCQSFCPIVSG
jgi:hypothetical protein